jgi:hypothetical protein
MQTIVKSTLQRYPQLWEIIRRIRAEVRDRQVEKTWRQNKCPMPLPAHLKRQYLRSLALQGKRPVFIETGTYYGDTIYALKGCFDTAHTIELSQKYYKQAKGRFEGFSSITVWQGDSTEVLSQILSSLARPAMFWLDGHYSGGDTALGERVTPIEAEVRAIAAHHLFPFHLVLVDDARLFDGSDGYPALDEFRALTMSLGYAPLTVENDIIMLVSANPA